jgi:hypothetical protein
MAGSPGGTGIAAIIGAVGAGIPAVAAWWRSTRVARVRADDAAWQRVQDTITSQQREIDEARRRADVAERNLRMCAGKFDRALALLDMNGIKLPPTLAERPWENGNGNGKPPSKG